MTAKPFPKALPHGPLREVLKDVHFVTGSVRVGGPVVFSRNMTVIREGGQLTLVNSVRLGDAGLAALERLGKVAHVIRLAGFHGMDDPFYKDSYGATVWAVKGQVYAPGFAVAAPAAATAFRADVEMDETTALPLDGARLYRFRSAKVGEGLLVLARDGGLVVSGDCLQNWHRTDAYFSLAGKLMMRAAGFIKPCNIGPGWLKMAQPQTAEIRGILDLEFEHVLPAHGAEVLGGAKERFRKSIEKLR